MVYLLHPWSWFKLRLLINLNGTYLFIVYIFILFLFILQYFRFNKTWYSSIHIIPYYSLFLFLFILLILILIIIAWWWFRTLRNITFHLFILFLYLFKLVFCIYCTDNLWIVLWLFTTWPVMFCKICLLIESCKLSWVTCLFAYRCIIDFLHVSFNWVSTCHS